MSSRKLSSTKEDDDDDEDKSPLSIMSSRKLSSTKEDDDDDEDESPLSIRPPSSKSSSKEKLKELEKSTPAPSYFESLVILKGFLKPNDESEINDAENRLGEMEIDDEESSGGLILDLEAIDATDFISLDGGSQGLSYEDPVSLFGDKKDSCKKGVFGSFDGSEVIEDDDEDDESSGGLILDQEAIYAPDFISLDGGSNHREAQGLSYNDPISLFGDKKDSTKKGVFGSFDGSEAIEDVDEESSGGLILDQEAINAPDFISLDGGSNHREAQGLSYNDPISLFGDKKDSCKNGVFGSFDWSEAIEDDDEDEENEIWEQEQHRIDEGMNVGSNNGNGSLVKSQTMRQQQSQVMASVPIAPVIAGVSTTADVMSIPQQSNVACQAMQENITGLQRMSKMAFAILALFVLFVAVFLRRKNPDDVVQGEIYLIHPYTLRGYPENKVVTSSFVFFPCETSLFIYTSLAVVILLFCCLFLEYCAHQTLKRFPIIIWRCKKVMISLIIEVISLCLPYSSYLVDEEEVKCKVVKVLLMLFLANIHLVIEFSGGEVHGARGSESTFVKRAPKILGFYHIFLPLITCFAQLHNHHFGWLFELTFHWVPSLFGISLSSLELYEGYKKCKV